VILLAPHETLSKAVVFHSPRVNMAMTTNHDPTNLLPLHSAHSIHRFVLSMIKLLSEPQRNLLSRPPLHKSLIAFLALTSFNTGADSVASEWKTRCGITKESMTGCLQKKGDVVLNGVQGTSHTFIMPTGKSFQWFYSNGTLQCQYENNTKLKTPAGVWFNVYAECQPSAGAIVFYLPSGNQVFAIEY